MMRSKAVVYSPVAFVLAATIMAGCIRAEVQGERILSVGNTTSWTFFNGPWIDGPNGMLQVVESSLRQDGPAMQGHHYAFFKDAAYRDFRAKFEIRLTGRTDTGLILRAINPRQFYLLHFPNCGQASRAQHFWAVLSRMDEDGYLRIVKLDLVRRVPSTNGLWLPVEAEVRGHQVRVRIGESGIFEASDTTYPSAGRVGVYLFGKADIRNVRIEGPEVRDVRWEEEKEPRRTWFYPTPGAEHAWQRPQQLVRVSGGDLLLNYISQEGRAFHGNVTHLIIRSGNNGKTWSAPQPIPILKEDESSFIHVFPDGKLRMLIPGQTDVKAAWSAKIETPTLAETEDGGRTWSARQPVKLGPMPPGLTRIDVSTQGFLNLADGSVLMIGLGGHESAVKNGNVWQWGSAHCQAFVCRSTDNGHTWSDWVNIDNPGVDAKGQPIGGNLDLTETCAAQTASGKIFALIRPIYSPWMWEASSTDSGRTWGPVVRGPFPGYATPNMLRTRSGAILVAHRLPYMTIHTSLDDGRTFDQGTIIDSATWAMGSMLEVEPNLVLYVYWDSFESLMRAQLIRVTKRGIEPTLQASSQKRVAPLAASVGTGWQRTAGASQVGATVLR